MNRNDTILLNDGNEKYSRSTVTSHSSFLSAPFLITQSPSPSLINLVGNSTDRLKTKKTDLTAAAKRIKVKKEDKFHIDLPLFFNSGNKIRIPKTIENAVKHLPTKLLKEIHSERVVAVEMCLLFTIQLSSKYFGFIDGSTTTGWKSLSSKFLREFFSYHPTAYKHIINALAIGSEKDPIIEVNENGKIGIKCNDYRFGKACRSKKLVQYELKTQPALKLLNKHHSMLYNEARKNPICNNLIQIYPYISLPTEEEIKAEAKRLVKLNYSKKGKELTFLNKHPKSYFKNPEKRSFVEDALEIFEYLTKNGLMIPRKGSEKSGGRVVDAFSRMPAWIRNLVKVNGESLDVWDLSCLHPNIAMSLYGGSKEFLTHGVLAEESGIPEDIVKIEHLSFFNKHPKEMEESPLFEYYTRSEAEMMKNIINEKYRSRYQHRITSRRMFKKEVEIMTDVITQLNKEGIKVLYIYDALGCLPNHSERVKQLLDETALKHGVKTRAKQ